MSAGPLWTVAEMAAAMGAERQGVLPSAISGISIDSRSIAPGEAFFALALRFSYAARTVRTLRPSRRLRLRETRGTEAAPWRLRGRSRASR